MRPAATRALVAALALALGPLACAHPRVHPPLPPPLAPLTRTPDAPFRAQSPAPEPARPFAPPAVESLRLANGLRVFVVPRPEQHTVTARYVARLAGEDDMGVPAGLASLTARMLDANAGPRGAAGAARARQGVSLEITAERDATTVSARVLPDALPSALAALARAACQSRFEPRDFDRAREALRERRRSSGSGGGGVAVEHTLAALYGEGHPYARPLLGTPQSIASLRHEQVERFYRTRFVPSESALVVAGPATTAEVAALLDDTFAACRDAPAATRSLPAERSRRTSPRIHLIHARDAREAELVFGLDGVAFAAPDRAAFEVLAAIAGGMFSSRLNTRLREEAGLTYGVHAETDLYREGGTLLFETVVPRERAAEAVRMVLAQLARLREAPVAADELAAAKATLRGRLVSRFETSEATADAVADLFAHGLPPDAYGALAARLEAVTAADVQAAARRYIDLNDAEIAVVADRPAVEDGLRGLRHGEVLSFVFAPPE